MVTGSGCQRRCHVASNLITKIFFYPNAHIYFSYPEHLLKKCVYPFLEVPNLRSLAAWYPCFIYFFFVCHILYLFIFLYIYATNSTLPSAIITIITVIVIIIIIIILFLCISCPPIFAYVIVNWAELAQVI